MPCYLGGNDPIAGIKWIGSRQHNPKKFNIPRASALIVLNDSETNYPVAVMEGSLISAMRTAAITGVSIKYLAKKDFSDITVIGCGPIAQMQIKTVLEQYAQVKKIHLFDVNPEAAEKLKALFLSEYPNLEMKFMTVPSLRFSKLTSSLPAQSQINLTFHLSGLKKLLCFKYFNYGYRA
uniref:Ketimine reductase mu-crystallin n=1 Tax=Ditylenchus dipsaci TaxID=166011 RepID=A0A915DV25_9BILA